MVLKWLLYVINTVGAFYKGYYMVQQTLIPKLDMHLLNDYWALRRCDIQTSRDKGSFGSKGFKKWDGL